MNDIPTLELPGWPDYGEEEIRAVTDVLRNNRGNYWFGEEGKLFEQEFAHYCDSAFALTVGNGTLALELALRSLKIKPGDEVIVTPRTFIASANCILLLGATPVFVDIDPISQNITAATIEQSITPKTKAIIAVHLAGWPCDMEEIMTLASQHDIYVIEDCAQAHGASINSRKVGGIGHVAAFSFCHDKIMSAGGEGGLLVTDDEEIWARAASFRNHGKDPRKYELNIFDSKNAGMDDTFGSNYRMTEMQSAICRVQFRKLDEWVKLRRRNAQLLSNALADCEAIRITTPPAHVYHVYYKYYFFLDLSQLNKAWSRDRIIRAINQSGVPCSVGTSAEIYRQHAYVQKGYVPPEPLPVAKELGDTGLILPVSSNLGEENMRDIGNVVSDVLKCAIKS